MSDNFLRPETLREANDRVSTAISQLPIFRHYDIGDVVHSSSDGQKFETSVRTFNAPPFPQVLESIKIRVLVRPVNGENLSPIRGMPGRLTRDPSPKYGLSTHFFLLSIFKSDPSRDSSAFWLD